METEISEVVLRILRNMGLEATPESLESMSGEETSPQKPPKTETRAQSLGLSENPEWRRKYVALDESSKKVERLAQWCEWFIRRAANNARDKGHWLVIGGPPGVGKTHVARKAFDWLSSYSVDLWHCRKWHKVPKVTMWDWSRILEDKRDEVFDEMLYGLNGIQASDVVILDDVGAEVDRFKSGINKSRLRQAINTCEGKWMLMTTNIGKADWEDQFGVRGADRLRAANYVDLTGVPSYRPKLRR